MAQKATIKSVIIHEFIELNAGKQVGKVESFQKFTNKFIRKMPSYFLNVEMVANDALLNEMLDVIAAYQLAAHRFGQCVKFVEVNKSHVVHNYFVELAALQSNLGLLLQISQRLHIWADLGNRSVYRFGMVQCSLAKNFQSLIVDYTREGHSISHLVLGMDEIEKIAPVFYFSLKFCLSLEQLQITVIS